MAPPPAPAMAGENTAAAHGGRRRVLLFPLPYQGHINPMFRLAGVLHARGFAITVFHTHFNAPDPARHPAYQFVPVPDGFSGCTPVTVEEIVAHVLALNPACEAAFRERLAAVLNDADDVACLIADGHLLSVLDVARQLGVPTLALRTGSAACFACFVAYPLLCAKGYVPVQESQLDTPVAELPPYRVRDLMSLGNAGHDMLCEMLSRAVVAAESSSGLILNTFDALECAELAKLRRDLSVPVFDIGPLHKLSPAVESSLLRQDRTCLEWLDAQAPASVLYVSFGSLACMGPQDLVETAWGIAHSGVPFLWVIRPGLVRDSPEMTSLPDGFDDETHGRGMVVKWAPQEEVLSHPAIGGFWTHNGWNSTMESICEGVPMLCRPYFGDQTGNARYVEHVWQVGFEVDEELERGKVEKAVRRLMVERDGGEMRERARDLKKKATECITKAGSSCLAIEKLVEHLHSM